MALSCAPRVAKGVLFVFNVIFWITGAILLGVGIWFLVDDEAGHYLEILTGDSEDSVIRAAAIALTTVGALIFITGFFGCCGAWKESQCMLNTYAIILIILLTIQMIAGILGVVFKDELLNEMEESMNKTLQEKYLYNATDDAMTNAWDFMQVELKCCGTFGYEDWKTSNWKNDSRNTHQNVPMSCCKLKNSDYQNPEPEDPAKCQVDAGKVNITNSDWLYHEGCSDSLEQWVHDHAALLIGVAFGLIAVQLVGIILACCLKGSVKSQYEYV